MSLIRCPECSNEISDKAKICPNCGKKINKTNNKNIIVIIILIALTILGYSYFKKQELKELLLKDWERVERISTDNYYTLKLDFSETKILYKFDSIYSWLDSTLMTYDYKIINSRKIKINDQIYEIEFNEEKTMMTITPSLTDSSTSKSWFNFD